MYNLTHEQKKALRLANMHLRNLYSIVLKEYLSSLNWLDSKMLTKIESKIRIIENIYTQRDFKKNIPLITEFLSKYVVYQDKKLLKLRITKLQKHNNS